MLMILTDQLSMSYKNEKWRFIKTNKNVHKDVETELKVTI